MEVPDEISLGLIILGCPLHCPECHSSWTWSKKQPQLEINQTNLAQVLSPFHSCILFFGGEWEADFSLALESVLTWFNLPLALYTGLTTEQTLAQPWIELLTYVKTGPYIKACGGLRSEQTNQRMFKLSAGKIIREYKFYGPK